MSATVAVEALLAVAVVIALLCCFAMLIMSSVYERLHYLAPVATVSAFCILLAVVVEQGWGQATVKTAAVFVILLLSNAVLSHATARACRVHERGHWAPGPEERIAGLDHADPGNHGQENG